MRKLASIQKIADIQPIEGADKIECATVQGWKVVIRKDEFSIGDLCVYCEIDSLLPKRPEFSFLEKVGYRIKTIRLRGQISQGICFPLSILPDERTKGDDVTELLGIEKYEKTYHGKIQDADYRRSFPGYAPKTDEIRVQSNIGLLDELNGIECYVTVKIDGTSATFCEHEGEIDVCSRNRSLKDSEDNLYWQMARKYRILDIFSKSKSIAIQGEIAGPGIRKNPLGLESVELFVFDIFDIKKHSYYSYSEFVSFCGYHSLQTVPVDTESFALNHTVDDLLVLAKGQYIHSGKHREGIVIRPKKELYSYILKGRASFKVINNDYL